MFILKYLLLYSLIIFNVNANQLCTPQLIVKNLKTIDNKFLPFEVFGINNKSLVETESFLTQIAREAQIPIELLIERIKTVPQKSYSKKDFLDITRKIKEEIPSEELQSYQSLAITKSKSIDLPFDSPGTTFSDKDVIIEKSPIIEVNESIATQTESTFLTKEESILKSIPPTASSNELIKLGRHQLIRPKLELIEDIALRFELSRITSIKYPAISFEMVDDPIKRAQDYLNSAMFRDKYPDLLKVTEKSSDLAGTRIGQGSFKSVYLTPNGDQVIKIVDLPKKGAANADEILRSIQREIAIQEFLLRISEAYISAGKKPPFRVAKINTDPELLKRGIIIQEFVGGSQLNTMTRSTLDSLYSPNQASIKLTKSQRLKLSPDELIHKELTRIPQVKELDQIFSAFNETLIEANVRQNATILAGKVKTIDSQGEVIQETLRMGIDIGGNFRNLSFDPSKDPPLTFFDW